MNHNQLPTTHNTEIPSGDIGGPNGEGMNSSIDMSAFEDSLSNETAAENSVESLEQQIESPNEAVQQQSARVENVILNTNREDMLRFAAKITRKRNEAFVSGLEFNKDTIKQNQDVVDSFTFDKDEIANRDANEQSEPADETDEYYTSTLAAKLNQLADRVEEEGVQGIARSALRKLGKIAARGVTRQALRAANGTKRVLSAADRGITSTLDKGANYLEQRERTRVEARRQAEIASVYDEAEAMDSLYNDQAEAEAMDKNFAMEAEADAMNNRFDAETEAEEMNEAFDDEVATREAAQKQAYAARLKRARRILAAKNKFENGKDRLKNGAAKVRKLGGAAARFAGTVRAYHKAGKEAVNKRKELQNESQDNFDLAA